MPSIPPGVPRPLTVPRPLVPTDDGAADPALAEALAAFAAGTAGHDQVLAALWGARLLVPVVALLSSVETGEDGLRREKESEMALPTLVGRDGRAAVPVFTGAESLRRWRPDARPIQATVVQACQAAVQEGAAAVVLDVAGPVPFVLEGPVLQVLAVSDRPSPENLRRVAEAVPEVTVARIGAAPARSRRRGLLGRLRRT